MDRGAHLYDEPSMLPGHFMPKTIGEIVRQTLKVQVLFALSIFVVAAVSARAQSGRIPGKGTGSQAQGDDKPVRLRAEEVLLQVSFQSKLGKLPTLLDRSDFIVTEDDKRQQITSIIRTPANILLILDTSGDLVTLKNINLHRELALKLIESLGEEDKVAIITYADKVELLSSWTGDRAALKKALDWNFRPGPNSLLYDSLTYAARDLLAKVTGRRSVVLMTDGVDKSLQVPFEAALKAMHQARAAVYIVSQAAMLLHELKPKAMRPLPFWQRIDRVAVKLHQLLQQYVRELEAGQGLLHTLAEETGGEIWDFEQRINCANTSKHLGGAFAGPREPTGMIDCETIRNRLIEEIGSEYIIAYSSERRPEDTNFHPVKVYSKRTDLKVRVRRGIYADKQLGETARPVNQ
jgi:VWFA-related protein